MDKSKLSWSDSRCKGSWLHRYELKKQWPNAVQEVCLFCGKNVYFKIVDGRIDNLAYIKHHMRQVLLPQHPLYKHEYPQHA